MVWKGWLGVMFGESVPPPAGGRSARRPLAHFSVHSCRWIDRLVSYKFEYVVTPQTYGKNRYSPDVSVKAQGCVESSFIFQAVSFALTLMSHLFAMGLLSAKRPHSPSPFLSQVRLRWLGQSIDTLLQRYPRLKAAFLDSADTEHGPTQYSVCIKVGGVCTAWYGGGTVSEQYGGGGIAVCMSILSLNSFPK